MLASFWQAPLEGSEGERYENLFTDIDQLVGHFDLILSWKLRDYKSDKIFLLCRTYPYKCHEQEAQRETFFPTLS